MLTQLVRGSSKARLDSGLTPKLMFFKWLLRRLPLFRKMGEIWALGDRRKVILGEGKF